MKQLIQGELYKDIQGNVFRIVAVAFYEKCNETIVVYQEMFPGYKILAMSASDFTENLIPLKCVEEKIDSEIVSVSKKEPTKDENKIKEEISEYPQGVNPVLLDFLDSDSFGDKIKILLEHKDKVDDKCINDIAASLDVAIDEGDIDVRFNQLISCLETMRKYEIPRR